MSNGTPLLPKLRSQFAEFLRESYLDPLSIFYQPTCVGFGTGISIRYLGFSRRVRLCMVLPRPLNKLGLYKTNGNLLIVQEY